ncbi:MAG: lysophospholipid acyltransferase family protein [Saprospiraceae bacterium]|jgi:putative hemolysin|nr:lysophospholipid acyltransferase family protein [Saprospiraceae bacterium]
MPLVSTQEVVSVLSKGGFGVLSQSLSKPVMRFLKLDAINALYDKYKHLDACAFIDAVLQELQVSVSVDETSLKRLNFNGPRMVIANHPLGGIDGLILLRLLLTYRKDIKVMTNFILNRVEPLTPYFCAVNPFETNKQAFNSYNGFKESLMHLKNGGVLVIFPAGEVSTKTSGLSGTILDREWELPAIKLIKMAKVGVTPVFMEARNSALFYTLSAVHPTLRTAALPGELLKSRGKNIAVFTGECISVDKQNQYNTPVSFRSFLRETTYRLRKSETSLKKRLFDRKPTQPCPLALEVPRYTLVSEIQTLSDQNLKLFTSGDFEVYFTPLERDCAIMQEIGRLREYTFRAVGEGTQNPTDIDAFDEYYHHLILWDASCQCIAGAYRLGLGHQIWPEKGMAGFYLSSQFYVSGPVAEMFSKGIEMGRAFITQDYQSRPFPLFLLWKGIAQIAERYPACRYLMGAVSISSSYSALSQSCMVHFLQSYCSNHQLNQYVLPVNPFRHDATFLKFQKAQSLPQNMAELEKLIRTIEPNGLKMPVLIKKYLAREAKILGFNVDVHFNDSIDGLMYLDLESFDPTFLQR